METLPLIFLFLLGLCAGSFALAMTMRMYARKPWVNDRSRCDHCKKVLEWRDLIPVLSWVIHGGTCRRCKKKLSSSYPLTELGVGAAFVVSYLAWPYGFTRIGILLFGLWLIMLTLMASLLVFDLKWYLLPDRITYALIGLAASSKIVQIFYFQDFQRLYGIALGLLAGAGVFYALYVLSSGRYIGGGDVKFALFYGILLGSGFKSILVLSLASTLGTLLMLPALIRGKKKMQTPIAFGPSLIVATCVVYLFGDRLVELLTTYYLFP